MVGDLKEKEGEEGQQRTAEVDAMRPLLFQRVTIDP